MWLPLASLLTLNSCSTFGSGIADANQHSHENLPVLVAGGGNGFLKTGRYIKYAKGTPTANLWLTLLDRMEFMRNPSATATDVSNI